MSSKRLENPSPTYMLVANFAGVLPTWRMFTGKAASTKRVDGRNGHVPRT